MTSHAMIVLNWKMNVPKERITPLVRLIVKNSLKISRGAHIIICPSHELITVTADALKRSHADAVLGAQNCAQTLWGAHTGEISPQSLKRLGCSYVIIGHSERRVSGLDSDESIREKIELLLGSDDLPAPILCIGERQRVKSDAAAIKALTAQITTALKGVAQKKLPVDRLIIAYEPLWAIGTGEPVSLDVWRARHEAISRVIQKLFSGAPGTRHIVPILYGGSVSEKNVRNFLETPSGGVLIGGAGQQVDSLERLLKVL